MSLGKVTELQPLQGGVSEAGVVYRARLLRGVLVCACHCGKKVGAALLVPEVEGEGEKTLIRDLLERVVSLSKGTPPEVQVKLVAVQVDPEPVAGFLEGLGFTIFGRAEESRPLEVYYYADTGRLRLAPLDAAAPAVAVEKKDVPGAWGHPLGARKRVLVVDDSKTIRQLLTKILSHDPELEVVGAAELPSQAERMIPELKPDVITLDINMPEMDGVTLLQRYIAKYPVPTVMISAISMEEGNQVLKALEFGAVDYIQKPSFEEIDKMAPIIVEKVKTAAHIRVREGKGRLTAQKRLSHGGSLNRNLIVAVGSSTGGTEALRYFFTKLPAEIPPIVVVQHIPPVFSRAFANRLAELCPFGVKEAADGDAVEPNQVLIAPGGTQMAIVPGGPTGFKVSVFDGPPVNRHKPSVDVLFDSVAKELGKRAIGIIMTGMGKDGAAGMLRMRQAGARTMAQDEASCVVFGMPKEAIKIGAAEAIHSLDEIPDRLTQWLSFSKK